jgi:beta-glucosidase
MPGAIITFVDGQDRAAAADAARKADLAIVFATQWTTEAQDVPDLSLPYGQDALIDAVAAAQPKTAVVLETGGPVLMPWLARVPAVIEAWYSGQRGGEAIANILTGKVNPSGRLPITFMASPDQAPRAAPVGIDKLNSLKSYSIDYVEGSDVGYRWYEKKRQAPLFPFGHGLSYTSFAYRNLTVTGGKTLSISFEVVNSGKRAGADVPQLYVARDGSNTPMRLAGFQRVTLKPGEARRVTLTAEPRILADYDTSQPGWRIKGGTYRVALARNATDRGMTTTVKLSASTMKP